MKKTQAAYFALGNSDLVNMYKGRAILNTAIKRYWNVMPRSPLRVNVSTQTSRAGMPQNFIWICPVKCLEAEALRDIMICERKKCPYRFKTENGGRDLKRITGDKCS
jgi:hypothetical protein